ncbi:hypothetical protein [Photobacterium lucens]|uniref:hypothetical protein n=1 Tax=Photobacterium lucens TaxID=2562949 RepID=UPI0006B46367|nr:hypothetical protein [Photobacterium lucens]KPA52041.1 hypothetical protein VT25_18405 [Photobacterium leiognathi subsp. mandapamensis]MBP2699650.1 hypothetical protein [Vibrio parahaemolyticus]MZG56973.1 hypothetical protein [Photobacterium lucens]MZG79504.1 hypothetical protein [Photobacterium lucens]
MSQLKLGRQVISDLNSVEYKWIETLNYDGLTKTEINQLIKRCLGGDDESADILRRIAMKECSPLYLLDYLDKLSVSVVD